VHMLRLGRIIPQQLLQQQQQHVCIGQRN
jgi:hypothetical protein